MPKHLDSVLIIGYGTMGQAMAACLNQHRPKSHIHIIDPIDPKDVSVCWHADNRAFTRSDIQPDIILLAVKPDAVQAVLQDMNGHTIQAPIISIAAGVGTEAMMRWAGHSEVMRLMPNLGVLAGQSASAFYAPEGLDREVVAFALSLIACFGPVITLEREEQMHAVTALAGSGPAYFFEFCRLLAEEGARLGLEKGDATTLAVQTLQSAAAMMRENPDISCEAWCQKIAVPGGTTEAGLSALTKDDILADLVLDCLENAKKRSQDLAGID